MALQAILSRFHEAASSPRALMERYIAQGKPVILTAPVYTPGEIIHAMGCVPMGAWGADTELQKSKQYFPAFICSIAQSVVELGMRGSYQGASAIVIPTLCDSLKVLVENFKVAVPAIPVIPMTYPQNREPAFARPFLKANYQRVISDLERITGKTFEEAKLAESIRLYNRRSAAMRKLASLLANHPEVTPAQRSDVFKSAFFLPVEEHLSLVEELTAALNAAKPVRTSLPVMISGILADSPALNRILEDNGLHVVADDVAAQSRQYRTDAPEDMAPLDALCEKFCTMGHCSVLYDVRKSRCDMIPAQARNLGAKGVILVLTKFCDPEEFDVPIIRRRCDEAGVPTLLIEIDRQMDDLAQVRTAVETFRDMLS